MDTVNQAKFVSCGVIDIIGLEDPEALLRKIEHCGRIAYRTWDKEAPGSAERFVQMIVRLGHESVLEHASVTAIVRCDRATAQQLTRHRLASFTMESQRYCNYGNDRFGNQIEFVDPQVAFVGENAAERCALFYKEFAKCALQSQKSYMLLVKSGVPAEDARAVLPNCAACTLSITANIREWRHILKIRMDKHAQHNVRNLVGEIYKVFAERVPSLVSDIKPEESDRHVDDHIPASALEKKEAETKTN